jgi:pimeloyl-ACP methyl ester carboxylesterase
MSVSGADRLPRDSIVVTGSCFAGWHDARKNVRVAVTMKLIIACFLLIVSSGAALAEGAVFTYLKTVTAAELDRMLDTERARFLSTNPAAEDYVLPPVAKAANDVELYTVSYHSVIPEQADRKIMASGLLVIPVLPEKRNVPAIIYTHGTVFGKYEVPSYAFRDKNPSGYPHYDGAYETRYMAALFGGNGYAVIASDYFGMGDSAAEPESYFVKAATRQASYDLYLDAKAFLASRGIEPSHLFVGGWSQGGLNATGLAAKLEAENIPLTGSFTASSPSDPFVALNGLMYYPRPGLDAVWLNTIVALSVFAFENYHGETGLAASVLAPDVHDAMKSIYDRSYAGPDALTAMLEKFAGRPLLDYFRPEYRDPVYFAQSRYGQLLAQAETYRQMFKAPVKAFYGTRDEAIKEMVGRLPAAYQAALIGNADELTQNRVSAEKVVGADHRRTFISAAPISKAWMDGLVSAP